MDRKSCLEFLGYAAHVPDPKFSGVIYEDSFGNRLHVQIFFGKVIKLSPVCQGNEYRFCTKLQLFASAHSKAHSTKGKAGRIMKFFCFMSVSICFSYRGQS